MYETIINILKEISGFENIEANFYLIDDLGIDSLGMVTLLIALEDTFDIRLDESDMNPFDLKNIRDVVSLVKKYLKLEE